MLEALASSLTLVFSWPAIGYLLLGVVLGMWSGSVPGLGGIVALVVILPFTFGMEPVPAMALLLGLWAVDSNHRAARVRGPEFRSRRWAGQPRCRFGSCGGFAGRHDPFSERGRRAPCSFQSRSIEPKIFELISLSFSAGDERMRK